LLERTHLTMRHSNSRLVRKTLAYSKMLDMHINAVVPPLSPLAAAAWEDSVYNLVRPLKTLRLEEKTASQRHWQPRCVYEVNQSSHLLWRRG
jgi:hypothetical protein